MKTKKENKFIVELYFNNHTTGLTFPDKTTANKLSCQKFNMNLTGIQDTFQLKTIKNPKYEAVE